MSKTGFANELWLYMRERRKLWLLPLLLVLIPLRWVTAPRPPPSP